MYCLLVWAVDSITVCWFWRLIPLLFVGLDVPFLYCLLVWAFDSFTVCWFWCFIPLLFVGFGV